MGKRVDNDATQDVSASQLVSDTNPPRPVVSKNDVSMWLSQPVGADEFMAAPKKRPTAPKRSINWIVPIGALVLVAIGGVAVWYGLLRESPTQMSPAIAAATGSAAGGSDATGSATGSAGTAATTIDAGVTAADAGADAGVAGAEAQVDAISGADPVAKKVTKKRPTKKKVTKKKTATAPKKTTPTKTKR